jgi:GTP cyclohydrolase I
MNNAPFPHCDERVLHSPGSCTYCDEYPDKQNDRILQNVNFTDTDDPKRKPCPAREARGETVDYWPGNRAKPDEIDEEARETVDRLLDRRRDEREFGDNKVEVASSLNELERRAKAYEEARIKLAEKEKSSEREIDSLKRNLQNSKLAQLELLERDAPSASDAAIHPELRESRNRLIEEAAKLGPVYDKYRSRNLPGVIATSTARTKTLERDLLGAKVSALVNSNVDTAAIESAVTAILIALGVDTSRPDLQETPQRVARFYKEFFDWQPGTMDTAFTEECVSDQMVTVSNVRVWSICAHHMLPFFTDMSMGYIADKRVLGLSKFARIAHAIAHGLQTQENIAEQVADKIAEVTGTNNVAVLCENGMHTCMTMRGIRTAGSMNNAVMRGVFLTDSSARTEFYNLIQRSRQK